MTTRTDYEQALHDEALAVRRIVRALTPLSADAKERIIGYLVDRFTDTVAPREPR